MALARCLETGVTAFVRYNDFLQVPKNQAPIDQKFDIVPSVNSLALYLLDGPLFVGSFEFSSQPLFVEELVVHYTRI